MVTLKGRPCLKAFQSPTWLPSVALWRSYGASESPRDGAARQASISRLRRGRGSQTRAAGEEGPWRRPRIFVSALPPPSQLMGRDTRSRSRSTGRRRRRQRSGSRSQSRSRSRSGSHGRRSRRRRDDEVRRRRRRQSRERSPAVAELTLSRSPVRDAVRDAREPQGPAAPVEAQEAQGAVAAASRPPLQPPCGLVGGTRLCSAGIAWPFQALEKKGISHLEEKELKERNKRIQEDNRLELQKVKQLRLEREREKAMREQELEMLQREKEAEHFKTWEEQEDNFHLQQAKLRSKIRIRDGRAKPIDLLAKYISAEDDDLAVEMHEPYTFLNGLTVADMEDLLEDIQVYMELEQGKNADFWRDMTTITEDEITKLRKLEASGKGPGERREGVNASVSSDVQSVFKGKTYGQLQVIFQGIEGKIRAGGPNLDMGYWESLLQQLRAHMARARLRERHQDVLRQKLYKLKQEQGVESEPLFPILKQEPPAPGPSLEPEDPAPTPPGPSSEGGSGEPEAEGAAPAEGEADGEAVLMEEDLIQQSLDDYDAGKYSPRLLTAHELPLDAHVLEPDEDLQRLQLSRQQLQVTGGGRCRPPAGRGEGASPGAAPALHPEAPQGPRRPRP
ncbi:cactin, partial [Suricata suricatta]|uniref:cactin n=1 Tax=Suricata suricatta TaxID=37032 RepID=UPI001155DF6E